MNRVQRWRKANPAKYRLQWQRANRLNYRRNKDSFTNRMLVSKYDITLTEYNALSRKQKHKCAICRKKCKSGRRLAVDHDHKTKKVRGLLCIRCNRGLGNFMDSKKLLRRAVAYL